MMSELKRVALVTGANKGIGFETARQLAAKDITVLLGARDLQKGEAAANELRAENLDVRFLQLDVTDAASIENARQFIEENFGRLDILVNNAGIAADFEVPASQGSARQWRETFETNVFSVVGLTQKLLPLIRKSRAGRIVNVSSILGSLKWSSDPASNIGSFAFSGTAYNASKAAVNMFTVHLANELKDTPIKVNAAHPGWVKTQLGGENAPLSTAEGAETSVRLATLPEDGFTGKYVHLDEELPW
jgi:NAD(P)-dependent dehydrogenase (short-subunit alcohol dehydrogenase family)